MFPCLFYEQKKLCLVAPSLVTNSIYFTKGRIVCWWLDLNPQVMATKTLISKGSLIKLLSSITAN